MKWLAFVLLSLCGGVFGLPALSNNAPDECSTPALACRDIESARRCNLVTFCIHDVWSKIKVTDDNDEICDLCKEMVKEARDQLLSNMTQEEIKEVFEGSCKLLTVKLIVDECIKLVDGIIPELVEMLASRMDPTQVCTVSGLCILGRRPTQPKGPFKDVLVCEFCTNVLEHVKELMTTNTTVAEFRSALLNFCKLTGSFSTKCTELVNKNFDSIFNALRNLNTKTVCTLLGLCQNQYISNELIPAHEILQPMVKIEPAVGHFQPLKTVECDLCKSLVQQLQQNLKNPSVKQTVQNLLEQGCSMLPGELATECKTFVDQNIDNVINTLVQALDPDMVCSAMGVCNGNFRKPALKTFKTVECDLCKDLVQQLQTSLKDPSIKQTLKTVIDQACSMLPGELASKCKNFMDQNIDNLIDVLVQEMDPNVVCSLLRICNSGFQKSMTLKTVECDMCKDLVQQLQASLKDPSVKQNVKNLLEQGCSMLPGQLATQCKSLVDQNIDAVINFLVNEMDPNTVCSLLGICNGGFQKSMTLKTVECDMCKDLVQQLQTSLKDPSVKQNVKNLLEQGCSMLPGQLATECKSFVDQNIDTVIDFLVNQMDPNTVCSLLGICNGTQKGFEFDFKDIECELCKELMQQLDNMLKDQSTEEEIKKALDSVCSLLPSSWASKCQTFVGNYADLIIALLAQALDPSLVCDALQVCTG